LQLARKRNVKPRAVLVICTSAPACRAALAAKMNCMALPDAFTSHQDFSGADGVLSAPDTRAVEEFFSVRR
jgi:beta-phosphoglucomutase-like phosphatase (HAD superfamily)